MLPQQGGHSSAVAGELSLSLEWSLLLFDGLMFLYREKPSTHLDLADFFPIPCSAHSFQRCCSMGTTPSRRVSAWKQQPSSPGSSLLGWKVASPSRAPAARGASWEMSRGSLLSPAPHIFSPPGAPGRNEICWHDIREKGLVRSSALPLECCPWRFGICLRLLVHQLFNSLQPCGLQPRVLVSSERTGLPVGGKGLGRGMQSRGWAEDSHWEAKQRHRRQVPPDEVLSRALGQAPPFPATHWLEGWVLLIPGDDPEESTSLLCASLYPPIK